MMVCNPEVSEKVEQTKNLMKDELVRHGSDPTELVDELQKGISEVLHADCHAWDEWEETQFFRHWMSELLGA